MKIIRILYNYENRVYFEIFDCNYLKIERFYLDSISSHVLALQNNITSLNPKKSTKTVVFSTKFYSK